MAITKGTEKRIFFSPTIKGIKGTSKKTIHAGCHLPVKKPIKKKAIEQIKGVMATTLFFIDINIPPLRLYSFFHHLSNIIYIKPFSLIKTGLTSIKRLIHAKFAAGSFFLKFSYKLLQNN